MTGVGGSVNLQFEGSPRCDIWLHTAYLKTSDKYKCITKIVCLRDLKSPRCSKIRRTRRRVSAKHVMTTAVSRQVPQD